ncbi:MAG: NAD(P)-binding protein [Alphaproteobacteria bacterium]|jgi:NADPH-dependent glutamate synthase beta subunit-like oxidoreductase/Pyruvate/2-oxoacid:ferredoxin oxidoreductase delta subunit|nr:glutamate synthase [Rhodospirillaceae bacterium]MDP6023845.1 NAD(P)-binding protein [Alphaproteobacteria bacterium]MDP6253186.1 NAD(P)-binding protein [Alphaproteobacteria bacterium]MDP7055116.1 NAD(P)-binding protein [Alphaproteobacteria bacterium]MDP7228080.1 NAD(P)-binding protein [Alphaproteobacteria bacterium]|tara:strand:- start:4367 stop:6004 length:1638 start_codon:yes stop_codon:yes gene_type:complete
MSQPLPFAVTLDPGSSLANQTGSWRTERPLYLDRLPPCNNACPAGENIQQWLYHAEEGDYFTAWQKLMEDNPLPSVMGRVCYHPCEDACNRVELDEAVGIHAVERFLGKQAWEHGWNPAFAAEPSGKRVLVVGAGPSGLAAAYHLTRMGHVVTIREAGPMAGGMMRFGIPKYRLPREVLDYEIQRILDMGVVLQLNSKVEDLEAAFSNEGFDAVFVAVGAHLAKRIDIPANAAAGILDAVSLLRDIETGAEPPRLGRRVIVYGGGNTAMDVARTAKRLGVDEPMIVYRRSRKEMPAHEFEAAEAEEEGVMIHWLRTIKQIDATTFTVEKMEIDASGRPQPTGAFETLEADTLILALGQDADTAFLERVEGAEVAGDGTVSVNEQMMTGRAGLFAGGDMVPSERTATVAVGHGKKAARHIDAWLRGESYRKPEKNEIAAFDHLNTWYYDDAPQTVQPALNLIRRQSGFEEVQRGLTDDNALFEARRCLSCGNCFECDNCYGICPDNAVEKLGAGNRFEFKYDYCKGCGLCAAECPSGAIKMEPEDI